MKALITMPCCICGNEVPQCDANAVSVQCHRCLAGMPHDPDGPPLPRHREASALCANFKDGACLARELESCCVRQAEDPRRCGYLDRSVIRSLSRSSVNHFTACAAPTSSTSAGSMRTLCERFSSRLLVRPGPVKFDEPTMARIGWNRSKSIA